MNLSLRAVTTKLMDENISELFTASVDNLDIGFTKQKIV